MFLGNFDGSFDAKNRLNFPARLRDKVPEAERKTFILAWHPPAPFLVIYPESEWRRITQLVEERARSDPDWDRNIERHLYGNAIEVDLDGVGRILIPEKFKRWAGLKKSVTYAGVRNHIELWDKSHWDAEEKKRIKSFMEVKKDLFLR